MSNHKPSSPDTLAARLDSMRDSIRAVIRGDAHNVEHPRGDKPAPKPIESSPVLPHPALALLADLANTLKAVDDDYDERDSYKAAIALLAGEQRDPAAETDAPTAQRYYAVTGRIPEGEEDVTYIYQASDREHAVTQFTDDLWSAEVDLDRAHIKEVHGIDAFIDGVVVSDTPITEA